MDKIDSVLVTGCAGFIGYHLSQSQQIQIPVAPCLGILASVTTQLGMRDLSSRVVIV